MLEELTYDDVLLLPQHSTLESRSTPDTDVLILNKTIAPIMVANMETTGTAAIAQAVDPFGIIVPIHRFWEIEDHIKEIKKVKETCRYTAVTLGIVDPYRRDRILDLEPDFIFVDLAHADTARVITEIKHIRSKINSNTQILIAGNVATAEATLRLAHAGADIVKCGMGSGSICSTRLVTGCGRPQWSTIQECSATNVKIIADGGINYPGDIVKALAAGASFVMLGRMYAGTIEASYAEAAGSMTGDVNTYRGLASKEAQEAFGRGMRRCRVPEGIQTSIQRTECAADVSKSLLSSLKAGMSLQGAATLDDLRDVAEFVKISSATIAENNAR